MNADERKRTRLVRSADGGVIHLRSCRYGSALSVVPWVWAEGRSNEEIAGAAYFAGVRACKVCNPLAWAVSR